MKDISCNFIPSVKASYTYRRYRNVLLVQNIKRPTLQTRNLELTRTLQLKEGQTALISEPSSSLRCIKLSFDSGIARIYGSLGSKYEEMTLGFVGSKQSQCFRMPQVTSLLLEGMTDCLLEISYIEDCNVLDDCMMQWLLELHIIRHPVGADSRLYALFCLLVRYFGELDQDRYVIPFSMAHSLIAELIGSTRSTVTRLLSKLRKNNYLISHELETKYILSKTFIDKN